MNDQISTLKDDLAFMRALAQDGDQIRPRNGAILVAAGLIYGAASLGHWAIATHLIEAPMKAAGLIWSGAFVLFMACLILVNRGAKRGGSAGHRAAGMAWAGVGWAIFTLFVCAIIIARRTHSAAVMMLLPSIVLALYGAAWSVAAAVSARRWTWLLAMGAFAAAILTALVSDDPVVFLVYTGALTLLATVPGLAMMRRGARA